MRAHGSRKKKLVVAFHFQFANQAAWKCDLCRKSGLEVRRRCGWTHTDSGGEGLPIWARGRVSTANCPTSHVTAESMSLIEEFHAWKLFGAGNFYDLPARVVEAFFVLENELRQEISGANE